MSEKADEYREVAEEHPDVVECVYLASLFASLAGWFSVAELELHFGDDR